jgi:late competence protein required for DNA uptake (superfamily II DNA/RNA helicase)
MTSKNLSFYGVDKCGKCGSDDLELSAHKAKDRFKYVTIKCKKCKAYLNFGQQQENPDVFYLRTKDEGGKKVLDWKDANTPMDEI